MKTKLLLSTIVGITIVATIGFGLGPNQKMTSAFADPAVCDKATVPINGSSVEKTYTIATGFGGDPSTFNGQCVVDSTAYSTGHPCTVTNGIASAGHCAMVTKGYVVTANGPATLPTEEWFHFQGIVLKPGEFLDMVDSTPFVTTKGHVAMVIPCDQLGRPIVKLYQGIIDGGVNTLQPAKVQFLQQLSDIPNGLCVYHFDIGNTATNPDGVTDFALINTSPTKTITFGPRNTATFSITEGYENIES